MTKFYAGIGSRETPQDVCETMTKIAKSLSLRDYTLRSGGAKGADRAFQHGAKDYEIFYAKDHIPMWCNIFVENFHPNPMALAKKGDYAWNLMARNSMQVLGKDGDTPVDFVVCWTKGGTGAGGTGQAIRIANYFGIPVYDLGKDGCEDELREFIKELDKV